MLVYLSSPYSNVKNKENLMRDIARFSAQYMLAHPGEYAVSGLVHHYATLECDELGTDYQFWKEWCELFISKCDKVVVIMFPGWHNSTGVTAEIELAHKLNKPVEYREPC